MEVSTWTIDPAHSSINFSIKHMMISKAQGCFEKFEGKLKFDPSSPLSSSVEAKIEAASVNTRDAQRDTHLKSADFFDVEKFQAITFRSTDIKLNKNGPSQIIGDLTIKNVTKSVTLNVEGPSEALKDPWGNIKIGASITTLISRKDFGLTWNTALEAGGFLVGDDVSITLEMQFVKNQ
jgi:polyisoprenoid-binding protein YceI